MYRLDSIHASGPRIRTDRVPEQLDRQLLQGDTLSSSLYYTLTLRSNRSGGDRNPDIDLTLFSEPTNFRFTEGL
jgi:hypothetical protein